MKVTELTREISVKEIDIDHYTKLAIEDDNIRDEIIRQMITNPDIMVYYHCYYVADKASFERPELFYPYWPEIAPLLQHANSYHRDFALTILANLTKVDQDNLFSKLFDGYFEHLNDTKFMTSLCCVRNSLKIIRNKPELRETILALLLDVNQRCTFPEKQVALMKFDILVIVDSVYAETRDKESLQAFIKAGIHSISPKTRRKAKDLVKKYNL
jgi:hypothetical protein